MTQQEKTRVAVLFGGRSTEHEISIITGLQVLDAFDSVRFETIPIYVDSEGFWYTGDELRKREIYIPSQELKNKLCQVRLSSDPQSELIEAAAPKGWLSKREPKRFPVDVFFPAFHGSFGEDGCIQGFFELIGADYVGSGTRASAIAMNKHAAKKILSTFGISVLPGVMIHQREWDPAKADVTVKEVLKNLPFPLIVKPNNLGSSIGVSSAVDEEQLMISLAGAFAFDSQVLVEPFLDDMYELNISVLEGDPPRLSAIERPGRDAPVLTFEQKYMKGNKKLTASSTSQGMASLPRDLDPADVPAAIKDQVRKFAVQAFNGLDCRGVIRIDFLVNKKNGRLYLNEINPLPGSFSYYLWEGAKPKITFTELLAELVRLAQEEKKAKQKIRRQTARRIFKET
ncbi:MAG: D-alanine--D-alanine ligase family protein [Candidatus Omnitrophota bacterium]